ncbi:alpha-1,6-mannosyltransferase subunit [Polychytrium aggregatum]|uniref:alpha-1,6-mannosyltransferase subunit n=1 Tax=Polychytrium aggregatum TaxID=110093 RepID=UPI0022FDFF6B|nr:alpha-1,6-mannosyltransferase subunit [Polychytrium aggregatum]KAI9206368.1 alpha-1,6-mannosyltransferase subunit [Polychytrium aggregatum]
MARAIALVDLLPLLAILLHLWLAPFAKVEESFNLQAAHDLLIWSPQHLDQFDHFSFPGVVPRTFVGPLALYAVDLPIAGAARILGFPISKFGLQLLTRGTLGLLVAISLSKLRRTISTHFGHSAALIFALLSTVQFHLVFWASRTLPNILALVLVNLAMAYWLDFRQSNLDRPARAVVAHFSSMARSLWLITVATVIFRSELVILAGPLLLAEVIFLQRLDFVARLIPVGLVAVAFSLLVTVAVDSYFWNQPFYWPELQVFLFNTYHNRSSEWGVSPFHAYFSTLLPKIAPLSYPLGLLFGLLNRRLRPMLAPLLAFLLLYSNLPHKEWRFVIYVVPMFNAFAAVGLSDLFKGLKKGHGIPKSLKWLSRTIQRLVVVAFAALLLLLLVLSAVQSSISSRNYPGGYALRALHDLESRTTPVKVHMDVATCMTGASRFGELYLSDGWVYSKNETHKDQSDYDQYSHVITSSPSLFLGGADASERSAGPEPGRCQWQVLAAIPGYERMRPVREILADIKAGILPRSIQDLIVVSDKLWILKCAL